MNRGNIKGGGLATRGEIRFSEQQSQRGREINIKGVKRLVSDWESCFSEKRFEQERRWKRAGRLLRASHTIIKEILRQKVPICNEM